MTLETQVVLAHISDVHLTCPRGFGPKFWGVKRGLGFLNWRLRRQRVHQRSVVDKLVADIAIQQPHQIVVGGDVVNIGLPAEYDQGLAWLESLGSPREVCVVPGNHDIYVSMDRGEGVDLWRAYMVGDEDHDAEVASADVAFPFVRRIGGVAIIGVNSAVPTPPFVAAGKVGRAQLMRLGEALDKASQRGLMRVVVIHHPPLPGQAASRRGLSDAGELARLLSRHGADLVLHGHLHRDVDGAFEYEGRSVPVVGVASGSAAHFYGGEPLARYNLIRLGLGRMGAKIEVETRGLTEEGGEVGQISRREV